MQLLSEASARMAENYTSFPCNSVQQTDSDPFRATSHDKQGSIANTSAQVRNGLNWTFALFGRSRETLSKGFPS